MAKKEIQDGGDDRWDNQYFAERRQPFVFRGQVQVNFMYSTVVVDGDEPETFFPRSSVTASTYFRGFTRVLHGLACIYEASRVFVCNVCTGEIKMLPEVASSNARGTEYYFGYDPSSRAYKFLKIAEFKIPVPPEQEPALAHLSCFRLECEILTLGRDSSWRKLPATAGIPTVRRAWRIFYSEQPILINGVMYWVMEKFSQPPGLISFDLNKEEFRFIKAPQDPPFLAWGEDCAFAEIGGRPALYCTGGTFPYFEYLYYWMMPKVIAGAVILFRAPQVFVF